MIIKKYSQFIIEKMGVPDGIVDSATNLYELIVSKFEQNPNEELEDNNGVCNFQIDLPININISDMKFDMVNFNITVHINNKFNQK